MHDPFATDDLFRVLEEPSDDVPSRGDPQAREKLRCFASNRLRCPMQVTPGNSYASLGGRLAEYWKSLVEQVEVDCESTYIDPAVEGDLGMEWDIAEDDQLDELRALAINAATWYPVARQRFLSSTALFRVPMATRGDYPKHFAPARCRTLEDLVVASLEGTPRVSYFLYRIEPKHLHHMLGDALEDFFDDLLSATSFTGYVRGACDVGVVAGSLTSCIAIKWNVTNAHAYPVSPEDVPIDLLGTDVLDGIPRFTR